VTVAVVSAVTALVWIVKEAEALPAATVTVAGTLTAGELLVKLTTAPPGGATPFSITTALVGAPPVIGEKIDRFFSEGGWTVIETDTDDDPRVAVIVTEVAVVTWPSVNEIGAGESAKPSGTVTEAGTGTALGLLLVRLMTAPPAGAGAVS
jgi:hypothetical protein